jgi:high-affinity nickel-transport protein
VFLFNFFIVDIMGISGFFLLFLLGIRHGFDPDHIAIIDGVSMRYAANKPALARWAGTWFAIGHGSIVTLIAVMISLFSHSIHISKRIWDVMDWVPGLLLVGVGILNARMLLRKERYRPQGIRSWLLPDRLKNSSHPLAIVLIGALFAMVFDTTTQAAAWAYTAASPINSALLLGLCFSAGMITTDTLDSRILYRLVKRSMDKHSVVRYRRALGWVIVAISFMVGGYKIVTHLIPAMEIDEGVLTDIGIGFFLLMGLFYAYTAFSRPATINSDHHGY